MDMQKDSFPPIRNMADIEAIERVPLSERLDAESSYQVIARSAEKYGDRTALFFLPHGRADDEPLNISYAQLFARVTQTANLLADLGLGPSDAVAYMLPNLPQTHFTIWGGQAAGIVCAINPLLEPGTIADILNAAEAKVLVTLGPTGEPGIWEKAMAARAQVPGLETILQVAGPGDEADGILAFDELLDRYPGDRLTSGRVIGPDDPCSYFHTGGTTGSPKLARHRHYNMVYNAWSIVFTARMTTNDTLLCGLPLFHVNAVVVTGLGPFSCGARVGLVGPQGYRSRETIADFWKIVEKYEANLFSAVPTVVSALMEVPVGEADISSLRRVVCGAASLPVEVIRAFEERTGVAIVEGYGLTEGTCVSAVNPGEGERRPGSIGLRLPYQDMKTVVLDEAGRIARDCRTGEIGNVVIKGPNVCLGYKQEQFNEGLWAGDGWLNTGDMGRQDEDGYFWLTGRSKELIIRGGHNIDPAVIEGALHGHAGVALAAAVGKPDAYAGELPVAYVAAKPGVDLDPGELLEFARANIGERAAVPEEIFVIDEIPLTAVGKIFKPRLRWDAARRVLTAAVAAALEAFPGVEGAVEVGPDGTHGTLAVVSLSAPKAKARDRAGAGEAEAAVAKALGGFSVPHRIDVA